MSTDKIPPTPWFPENVAGWPMVRYGEAGNRRPVEFTMPVLQRIAACVNFCAGVATGDLMCGLSLKDVRAYAAQVAALRRALQLYMQAGHGNSTDHRAQGEAYDAAVEALK